MTGLEALPEGWVVWNDEPAGRSIIVFRPDVFDSCAFPAPCLPTIHLVNGPIEHRRPEQRLEGYQSDTWTVALLIEPDVRAVSRRYDDREGAIAGAVELAREFVAGDIDYRAAYQVPREQYLDRLDELVGREA